MSTVYDPVTDVAFPSCKSSYTHQSPLKILPDLPWELQNSFSQLFYTFSLITHLLQYITGYKGWKTLGDIHQRKDFDSISFDSQEENLVHTQRTQGKYIPLSMPESKFSRPKQISL